MIHFLKRTLQYLTSIVAGTEMQFAVTSEELMIARIEFDPEVAKRLTKNEAERLKSVSSYRANYLM
jgi:hypothetical protein